MEFVGIVVFIWGAVIAASLLGSIAIFISEKTSSSRKVKLYVSRTSYWLSVGVLFFCFLSFVLLLGFINLTSFLDWAVMIFVLVVTSFTFIYSKNRYAVNKKL